VVTAPYLLPQQAMCSRGRPRRVKRHARVSWPARLQGRVSSPKLDPAGAPASSVSPPGGGGSGSVIAPAPAQTGPLSVNVATALWLKALLGVTLFSQPWGVHTAGVVLLPACLLLVAGVSLYTAQMLVTVRAAAQAACRGQHDEEASKRRDGDGSMDSLPGLCEACLGPFGAQAAELAVLTACFGILASYLVRHFQRPSEHSSFGFHIAVPSLQAFTVATLLPLVPTGLTVAHALTWLVVSAGAVLCLPRDAEWTALLSAAGNVAAALCAGGMLFLFVLLALRRGWSGRTADLEVVAPRNDWIPLTTGASDAVPPPASALVACVSGYFVHFLVPSTQAAMRSPSRVTEALGRASFAATLMLLVFGAAGAAALGPSTPMQALDAAGLTGPALGAMLRCAAAIDVLTTVPVLCRPGLAALEAAVERSTGRPLQTPGAMALRLLFVLAAATAAALATGSSLLPFAGGAAAAVCALVLPPLLLLLGSDAHGTGLVHTSLAERCVAAVIAAGGVCAICLAALATFGRLSPVPMPITSMVPPGPHGLSEYDYVLGGDYAPPLEYAFTRQLVFKNPPPAPSALAALNWSNPALWNHTWAPAMSTEATAAANAALLLASNVTTAAAVAAPTQAPAQSLTAAPQAQQPQHQGHGRRHDR
jgi:amino acid permease